MPAGYARRLSLLLTLLTAVSTTAARAADSPAGAYWPQWRGPGRDAIAKDQGLLKEWPEDGPPLAWSASGAGAGYSSVVIRDGRIVTMGDREDGCYVVCFPVGGGEPLWAQRVGDKWGNNDGPRCTPSMTDEFVYALTPHGDLCCLTVADGSPVWKKHMKDDFGGRMMSMWGYSESPLVDGDWLLCSPGADDAAIVALDARTGEVVWKSEIPDCGGAGYSSIIRTKAGGVDQYVTVLGEQGGAVGVAVDDGRLLWRHTKVAGRVANIPTPIVRDDYVFYTTGYDDGGCALLKLVPSAYAIEVEEVYVKEANELRNHHGGVILVGDYLYGGHGQNKGFPFCANFLTGEETWTRQRGPGKGSAAVVYADGMLYFRYEGGTMALIEAEPTECRIVSTFEIPEVSTPSWAHPVIAEGMLYLRDKDRLLCYDVRAEK